MDFASTFLSAIIAAATGLALTSVCGTATGSAFAALATFSS